MASFGMMNPAYFVGKNILIEWVNNFLEIQIDKVETCANGAIYCNIFDALHPGTIAMKRLDFTVKHEFDFVKNWKILQNGFQKAGVDKSIPVQKLVKARYQDNLEFLQWFYQYARNTYNGDPDEPTYDAVSRRAKSKGGRDYNGSSSKNNKNRRNMSHNRRQARGKENNNNNRNNHNNRPISASNQNNNNRSSGYNNRASSSSQRSSMNNNNNNGRNNGSDRSSHNNNNGSGNNNNYELEELRNENKRLIQGRDTMQSKVEQLQRDHDELSAVAKDIEKERDFYFNKVLKVESLCKEHPDQSMALLEAIYNLLYQTEEEAVKPEESSNNDNVNVNVNDNNNNNNNNNAGEIQNNAENQNENNFQ